ncbi:MAG: glycosyltransferase [Patescibacteria group bacterium]
MIELSVIIPTYNRSDILGKTLTALDSQTVSPNRFETIIIDDGSSRRELLDIKQLTRGRKYSTKLLLQKHKGPAAARNKGILKARGGVVLIINDDTVPGPNLIERHLLYHRHKQKENYGLLGKVVWHPEIKVTPFMHWLENGGPYFSFNSIEGKNAGWQRLWTCNVSLKRSFLLPHGLFDEEFPDAAWEDIELGYRLHLAGLVLLYDRTALGYHYHPTSIASIINKMKANGRNLVLIRKKLPQRYWPPLAKHPRLLIFLDRISGIALLARISRFIPQVFDRRGVGKLYDLILLHYRISGFQEGLDKL